MPDSDNGNNFALEMSMTEINPQAQYRNEVERAVVIPGSYLWLFWKTQSLNWSPLHISQAPHNRLRLKVKIYLQVQALIQSKLFKWSFVEDG